MLTILLAVTDIAQAAAICGQLRTAGHAVVRVQRPLALLTEAHRTAWDAAVIDDSPLGRDVLVVLSGLAVSTPVIGVGFEDSRLSRSLSLPLAARSIEKAMGELAGRGGPVLALRPERRVAQANGLEVALTRSEFRLLETLLTNRPNAVSVAEAMDAVWGHSLGSGTPAPLRGHVRNLRLKLGRIGLPDSVQSLRGRGYSLAL